MQGKLSRRTWHYPKRKGGRREGVREEGGKEGGRREGAGEEGMEEGGRERSKILEKEPLV